MYSMILAMDKNGLIGNKNKLPWHLPSDLEHFKNKTLDKIIVMGRKTFDSIGRALPNRTNVVITRDKNFKHENVIVFHSLDDFHEYASNQEKEILIIGGSELIKQLYSYISKLYITRINHVFNGDCYVNFINFNSLDLIEKEDHFPDEQNNMFYSFCTYIKKDIKHFKNI